MYQIDCFNNYEISDTYSLINYYNRTYLIEDVFISSLIMDDRFIAPLWVLRDIFIGSCPVYFYSFFKNNACRGGVCIIFLIACVGLYRFIPTIHTDLYYTLLTLCGGMFLNVIWTYDVRHLDNLDRTIFGVTIGECVLFMSLELVRSNIYFLTLTAIIFTALIPYSYLKKLLSISMMEKISKLSFSIYLLHGPILFSFSFWVFYSLGSVYNLLLVFWLNLIVSVLFLITTCYLYYMLIERRIDILINSIKTFILKKS